MQGRVSVLVFAVAAMLAFATPARAAETFTVTGFADTSESCQGTSCPSIRSALTQALISPGSDTVLIPAGDYQLALGALQVTSDVALVGSSARDVTIRGTGSFRVLNVQSGAAATASHLTLRDGTADNDSSFRPGGVVRNSGTLTLSHVWVLGGHASSGGGVANTDGTLHIDHSLISDNSADIGGGDGGGILNFGSGANVPHSIDVSDSTIAFNRASGNGGGGVKAWGDAGIGTMTLSRVTIAYNNASSGGGMSIAPTGQQVSISGSIVGQNSVDNCNGPIADGGRNLESAASCGFAPERSGIPLGLSGGLANLGGETNMVLMSSSSPAIDAAGDCAGSDQRDIARPQGEACDAGAMEAEAGAAITVGPSGSTNRPDVSFSFDGTTPDVTFECRLDSESDQQAFTPCSSPQAYPGLRDGTYTFLVRAMDANSNPVGTAAVRNFRVDTAAPDAPVIGSGAGGVLSGTAEPNAMIEILEGGAVVGTTTAGADGAWSYTLPDGGLHTYSVRATDVAGNVSPFSAPLSVGTLPAQPTPSPTLSPSPAPVPTPVPQKSVTATGSKAVLVRVPGGKFVPLDPSKPIPLGSTIDTRKSAIVISAVLKKGGKVQQARFSEGIFKVTQTKTTTDLTLNEALAPCPKHGRATAAAKKKPKSRKLWGEGSGSFRTRGQYSAATVRGTKWLVQDSCSGTLTRVATGVVSVRDNVKRKTIVLRAGKSYLARPKRR